MNGEVLGDELGYARRRYRGLRQPASLICLRILDSENDTEDEVAAGHSHNKENQDLTLKTAGT